MEKLIVKKENTLTPMEGFKKMLSATSVQEQFKNALQDNKDLFIASLISLYGSRPDLQECDNALIVKEALTAATLKLPLNNSLGFAYIVPFKNNKLGKKVPTFILGYKGYIQLAMRTGYYKYLNADVVYEGELTGKDKLTGFVSLDGKKVSDKVIGYFCYFELTNGFSKMLYISVEDMAQYAINYSPSVPKSTPADKMIECANAKTQSGIGWFSNFTAMALKTVVRGLLSKYGYLSIEMQQAMENDSDYTQEAKDAEMEEYSNAEVLEDEAIGETGPQAVISQQEETEDSRQPNF